MVILNRGLMAIGLEFVEMYAWVEMVIVTVCVGAAGAYLLLKIIRGLRNPASAGCGGSCGCGVKPGMDDRLGKRIDLVQLGQDGKETGAGGVGR